ncbi:recombinase RecT [Salipiger manganoxidans]|uniref:recombinase RecT n=1 Tax=Salipiger marinus TaxID=555512 RepID=UPI001E2B99CB|nr:recombinase RecT [Salipiger manganoxidans]MCD1619170.1 recombinase RecT [Salipiger manganoxidans]
MAGEIAKIPLRQVGNVKELLHNEQARQQLAAVAAKHMSPERLMRITANAIRTTPKLQQAEPLSFLGALMQCAALGLEPNTVLGHAYLIPFDNRRKGVTEVQVVVGYKGLIDLARRSGHITSISANIHYSDDELWLYEEGTEAQLRHRPGPQNGEKLHAYAIAKFTDGGHAYVVLPWAKVMKIRDGSQGWQSAVRFGKTKDAPWATHEDAMAMKTAIRALSKYLPLSVEFIDAVQVDHDGGARVDYAQFALHPEAGPEVEGDYIDGEAQDAPEADEAPAQDQAKPAPAKEKAKPAPREKVDYTETKAAPADAPESEWHKLRQQIEDDLSDGAPRDATRSFFADKLAEMEKADPETFAAVHEMLAESDEA